MKKIADVLIEAKRDLLAERERLDTEIRNVEVALAALPANEAAREPLGVTAAPSNPMPVDEAIVRAVDAGQRTPMGILHYAANELNVFTTVNSVRTRVSKLYADGQIDRDDHGWAPKRD